MSAGGSGSSASLACYGCVEFANNERTLAYYRWACAEGMFPDGCWPVIETLCVCPADSPAVDFVDPITDNVCWYDPSVPESAEFLGVIILNQPVKGSTFTREVTDNAIEGSILNRAMIRGRSFVFEVLILATSCQGMDFGKEWLRSLTEDAGCQSNTCESCFGRRMSIRTHCTEGAATDDGLHEWMSVGLVDGLQDMDDSGKRACCCVLQHATFTMQSESPYSFNTLPTLICERDADAGSFSKCFDWTTGCLGPEDPCLECDRCLFDPACEPNPFNIPNPQIFQANCVACEPLAKTYECCCTGDLPAGYDTTFRIEIYSGSDPTNANFTQFGLRDFQLQVFQNPKGFPCITDAESYAFWALQNACIDLNIKYIPRDSTLVIDGRTQRITLTCEGICRPYAHVVTSSLGSVFPLLARCVPMMICSEFSLYNSQFLSDPPNGVKPTHIKVDSYLRFRG